MKKLKNISLFKISVLFVLNILIKNNYLFIISIIILVLDNYKELCVYLIIVCIFVGFSFVRDNDYIRYGIVDEINTNYVIVDKILYKVKLYNINSLSIGDVIHFDDSGDFINEDSELKYNVLFTYNKRFEVVFNVVTRSYIYNRINSFDSITSSYLKKIILNRNTFDEDLDYIGYGFAIYYLLLLLNRKDRRISLICFILYILFFGFNIKFYLLIVDYILDSKNTSDLNKLLIKFIVISMINVELLFNSSIIISLLFTYLFLSEYRNSKFIIAIIQSLFFNEVKILSSLFFRYSIYLKIVLLVLSILVLIFPFLSSAFIFSIEVISKFFTFFDLGIRGKVSLFWILMIFILCKFKPINKDYIRILMLLFVLITPLNNPLLHISFINVGQGDSCLIYDSFRNKTILIDTGSKYNYSKLKKTLYKEGLYCIDYLIITHNDDDHCGNIDNLNEDFYIKNIITSKGTNIEADNFSLINYDLGQYNNDNDNSLVYLLEISNYKVLFTGDISSNVENVLINRFNIKDIDVLKVSHHGSNTASSNYFIGNLKPKYAIISTSGKYNHPSIEVLNTLDSYLVKSYITKQSGNISFYFIKNYFYIKTDSNEIEL